MKAAKSSVADLLEEPRTSRNLLLLVQLLYEDLCAEAAWRARAGGARVEASEVVHAAALRALSAWPGFRRKFCRANSRKSVLSRALRALGGSGK